VEVTARGGFRRAIAMNKDSQPWGIAYCGVGDVVAVTLNGVHAVVLLEYESGAVKPEATIGSVTMRASSTFRQHLHEFYTLRGVGQLYRPAGVAFTADGRYILVADWGNHRVSKFSAASGAFISHAATKAANGISWPRDIIECEDGSVVVAQGASSLSSDCLVFVGENGGKVQNIIIPCHSGGASSPKSLSSSPSLNGVVVKTNEGQVFLLRDAWIFSSRCAWLYALSCC
jgi:hypothetical protein